MSSPSPIACSDGCGGASGPPRPARCCPTRRPAPWNRGSWDRAALINTDITELVKRQINTKTKIWQR